MRGPEILNRHHLGRRWPEGSLYVGRGTVLGNPYAISEEVSRDDAIAKFDAYLKERIAGRDPAILTALIGAARASALVCSCVPALCHATTIRERAMDLAAAGILIERPSLHYAGIGSRETPDEVQRLMVSVARRLAARGFTLRSGAAKGADSAFEAGAGGKAHIFLPWPGFNDSPSEFEQPTELAATIASIVHPRWEQLDEKAKALQARNTHQILGADCRSPVDFVVTWTKDGCQTEARRTRDTGGTGQAIALADRWGIPVFNLARPGTLDLIKERIEEIEAKLDDSHYGEPEVPASLQGWVDDMRSLFPGSRVSSVTGKSRPKQTGAGWALGSHADIGKPKAFG